MEGIEVEWDDAAVAHMLVSHGVTVTEAEEALSDIERVAQIPDPASRSATRTATSAGA